MHEAEQALIMTIVYMGRNVVVVKVKLEKLPVLRLLINITSHQCMQNTVTLPLGDRPNRDLMRAFGP